MGRKSAIKVGDYYGMWEVVEVAAIEQHGSNRKVLCRCGRCGYKRLMFVNNLRSGLSSRCMYCNAGRRASGRYGHPGIKDIKIGTRIGSLTVVDILLDTRLQRGYRTVKAVCLCGNTIVRRVDVIRRDEFPTCHHCAENRTTYRWPLSNEKQIPPIEAMDDHCNGRAWQWFDMTGREPVRHMTMRYITESKSLKGNNT